jgi:hypothetical protein
LGRTHRSAFFLLFIFSPIFLPGVVGRVKEKDRTTSFLLSRIRSVYLHNADFSQNCGYLPDASLRPLAQLSKAVQIRDVGNIYNSVDLFSVHALQAGQNWNNVKANFSGDGTWCFTNCVGHGATSWPYVWDSCGQPSCPSGTPFTGTPGTPPRAPRRARVP